MSAEPATDLATSPGRPRRRWAILAVGVLAQTAASSFVYGIPFLIPTLRDERGLSLAEAGVMVAAPTTGLLLTLVAWGFVVDRVGERFPMAIGLGVAGLVVGGVALSPPSSLVTIALLLGVGGMGAASVNAASGRLIMGWFTVDERGIAMGIRQTAQPLGVALAALVLPVLATTQGSFVALGWTGLACLIAAVLVVVVAQDAPRHAPAAHEPTGNPYRTPTLYRLHASSALLVLPQFAISAFALEYLVREQHWSPGVAGVFVAVAQILGAVGRIATGWWSDRVGSRLRPMRQLALGSVLVMLGFAVGSAWVPVIAIAAIVVGAIVTVADNGLAFVSTAEMAGQAWSGRALGVQNTTQNVVASAAPPVLGAIIGATSYGVGFAAAAIAPLVAIAVVPVSRERGALRAREQ
ncbi:MFS transporter [Actinomycetospora endophytica]|uniref:MFS transporter n=1 Tax=Actinomycetospora endophytica TaxID=2291215 RepID=A0ABS8P9R3_9PSEU|nr:MFS transporter [Actinomycetospora endophytica]MCD2195010.1 MFS transporter [Actinomycetospora endophytica]